MHAKRKESGKVLTSNCFNGTDSNAGCGVQGPHATFGEAFNNNGGGVGTNESGYRVGKILTSLHRSMQWNFVPPASECGSLDETLSRETSAMALHRIHHLGAPRLQTFLQLIAP